MPHDLQSDAPERPTACCKSVDEKPDAAIIPPETSGVMRRTALLPRRRTEQDDRQDSSSLVCASLSPPHSLHAQPADGDTEDEHSTRDEVDNSVFRASTPFHGSCGINSGHSITSSALIKQSPISALMPVPGSAALVDPFQTSEVYLDGYMATLLRLCRSHF